MCKDDFENALITFTRLYSFLSQIMPFHDIELEKLYPYIKYLIRKLPKDAIEARLKLDDEVALEYYRLQKIEEAKIALEPVGEWEIPPTKEAGIRRPKEEEKAPLSEIIQTLNERFGTDFNEADRLFFEQIVEDCIRDEDLGTQARANTYENFKYPFEDTYKDKVIDRMDQNQEMFNKLMEEGDFSTLVFNAIMKEVYKRLNTETMDGI